MLYLHVNKTIHVGLLQFKMTMLNHSNPMSTLYILQSANPIISSQHDQWRSPYFMSVLFPGNCLDKFCWQDSQMYFATTFFLGLIECDWRKVTQLVTSTHTLPVSSLLPWPLHQTGSPIRGNQNEKGHSNLDNYLSAVRKILNSYYFKIYPHNHYQLDYMFLP